MPDLDFQVRNIRTMAPPEQELHKAVRANDLDKVEELLKSGVSINCLFYGWTPLQLAIENDLEDMAGSLIDRGCNVNFHDSHSKSPFEDSVKKRLCKVVAKLLSQGVDGDELISSGDSALCFAVEMGSLELVTVLIEGNVNVHCVNKRNESALYIACQEGETGMVKALTKAGADVNCVHEQNSKFTPLIAAVAGDHEDIVKILIQAKCELDAQDSDGWTALWHAYGNSNEDICTILLKAGASTSIMNNDGKTVVQEANENEDDEFIELFSKFGHN